MWRDAGTWIALGVSALFVVVGFVMHKVFVRVLKQDSEKPDTHAPSDHGASTPTD